MVELGNVYIPREERMEQAHKLGSGGGCELVKVEEIETSVETREFKGEVLRVQRVGAEVEEDGRVGRFICEIFVRGPFLWVGPFCWGKDKWERLERTGK